MALNDSHYDIDNDSYHNVSHQAVGAVANVGGGSENDRQQGFT